MVEQTVKDIEKLVMKCLPKQFARDEFKWVKFREGIEDILAKRDCGPDELASQLIKGKQRCGV